MAQASVLTDTEIRRVFRIIETTRHAERNRLAFTLSIYSGLRVGEIAALTVGDVATADGKVRREIKAAHRHAQSTRADPRVSRFRNRLLPDVSKAEMDKLRAVAHHHIADAVISLREVCAPQRATIAQDPISSRKSRRAKRVDRSRRSYV